ncbi:molybdate ABC transporter substrate-binding protein [Desulfosporosinus sp. PR]|uniref:molybdate ABC transporter substrate-binding protein n=1 Tax=Candidatus Desulfosporosinus nitrosoreducens TaxID=3401928 RepID=UPI0027F745BF|nr:molybdate ABC transporter substrate-binding protein [Desulfosporosinus sp. PR]MDQ7093742.1 molybdate ABC transporter substrate-binding protein [Desulfosporosinus sp. PR]
MKKTSWSFVLCILMVLSLVGCGAGNAAQPPANTAQTKPTEITVSAAASLQNSLDEVKKAYEQKNSNIKLTINYGASGTLQQQIEQGAPVDLFISAGKAQVDALEQKNLTDKSSRIDLLGNDLVLITGKDNTKVTTLDDLTKSTVGHISIGTPKSVPAGQYAQEALTNLKLWDALQPKLVMAKDVTSVLNYVETGNADAGFVYKSDAQSSTKVKVVEAVPANSYKPVVYPAAIIAATKNKQAAEDFLKYLQGADAQKVFEKYGFKSLAK